MKKFHRIVWLETLRIAMCWPRRLTIIALLLNCSPEPEGGSKNANSWQIRILGSFFFCQFSFLFLRSAVIILNTNWTPLLNLAEGNVSAYIYLHLIPQILIQTSSEECIPFWTPSLIRNGKLIKLCLVFAIIRIPMCINAMCRLVTI